MSDDLLAGAAWRCGSTAPGALAGPAELDGAPIDWLAAEAPGTAASALRAAGRWSWGVEDEELLDGRDWWFRARFTAPLASGPWLLELGGIATLADVWCNGEHLLHSENMFLAHRVQIGELAGENELVIRCASLGEALAARHPRPRWKSRLVRSQSLRWYRTSLLGRMPGPSRWAAPVGPWRPITLRPVADIPVLEHAVRAVCDPDGPGGKVHVRVVLTHAAAAATLRVGEVVVPLHTGGTVLEETIPLANVARWWPHTHGAQPLYPVALELDDRSIALGQVGFRTIDADREGGGFALRVNGRPVFARGAIWVSPDNVSLAPRREAIRASLQRLRDAGMNMVRVPGYGTYEDSEFWDACDELGLLVWQDCMLASSDPPQAPEFVATIAAELREAFGRVAQRPSLAVLCGSSETYQQAAMLGLPPGSWQSPLLEQTIPQLLEQLIPGTPYVPSSPSGGDPPFTPDVGVAHYFGVGAYLRPLTDARRSGVRFAAECLAFATPPERASIEAVYGDERAAGEDPRWKLAVARDAGTAWDFEDVTDHYARDLFGADALRDADPPRLLDLRRATVCELMSATMSEWRRAASPCHGALVLQWQDQWPGAGWGLIDALGAPKAPLYALRRVLSPTAVFFSDEGLAGLEIHVAHDDAEPFTGALRLRAFNEAGVMIEDVEHQLDAPVVSAEHLLGGFRDLTHAYRFGPPAYDVLAVQLRDAEGRSRGEACFLPGGRARPRLHDLGLRAQASPSSERDGAWTLTVSTRLFAHYVAIDAPGFEPSDSWFHLLPGASATLTLHAVGSAREPAGSVRALNGPSVPIAIERA